MQTNFSTVSISDADEPGDAILTGMRHRDFDGVAVILLPDGESGDADWYGTGRTEEGWPTRPLLLFYRGGNAELEEAMSWLKEHGSDAACGPSTPCPDTFEDFGASQMTRTVAVHLNYPPYPWLDEARLGMEMGRYFSRVELEGWTEPTESVPGVYRFRFFGDEDQVDENAGFVEIDLDDLPD